MLIFFIVALVLSGITAFPVYTELKWAKEHHLINTGTIMGRWLQKVWEGVDETNSNIIYVLRVRLAGLCAYNNCAGIYWSVEGSC